MARRQRGRHRSALRRSAALFCLVAVLWGAPQLWQALSALLSGVAVVSTAITMPEGAVVTLRQRFAPELYDPDAEQDSPGKEIPQAPPLVSESSGEKSGVSEREQTGRSAPDIPEEYRAPLLESTMDGEENPAFYSYKEGWIRNYTTLNAQKLDTLLSGEWEGPAGQGGEPQILIYHTHATESYETSPGECYDLRSTWRSTDDTENMAAVGEALKEALEAEGFTVLHDTTQHDYPSYNGSYERSRETVESYLKQYPGITVLLDLHRDAILYEDNTVVKPVVQTESGKAAQVMIAVGWDPDGDSNPHWQQNLCFAAELTARAQADTPGLMRPVYFIERSYNQFLSPGALLLEFGSNGNTLEEAKLAAKLLAPSLAAVLRGE